jgi:hypothetical protein
MKIFCDIDGTICHTKNNDYEHSIPLPRNIEKINNFFNQGHKIIYWTARGISSGIDWTELTKRQLKEWGCKYHDLLMQKKPGFDLIIDNLAVKIDDL